MRQATDPDNVRVQATSLIVLIVPVGLSAAVELARIRGVGERPLCAIVGALIVLGVWRLFRRSSSDRFALLGAVGIAAAVSVAIVLLPWVLEGPDFTSVTQATLPVFAMIAGTLWLNWDDTRSTSAPAPSVGFRAGWLWCALVMFAGFVTIANRAYVGDFPEKRHQFLFGEDQLHNLERLRRRDHTLHRGERAGK